MLIRIIGRSVPTDEMSQYLELLDWRRRVAMLYGEVRARPHSDATAAWFRDRRDRLFREHPQSPIPAHTRDSFRSLGYWPWNAAGRVEARFRPALEDAVGSDAASINAGEARLHSIGTAEFELFDVPCELRVLWLEAYGGGVFIPFRDATSGAESYGGGRYLVDSVKGADLGSSYDQDVITLDFNYAYHPSCAYDPIWPCPLAPPENRLPMPVRLGERLTMDARPL
ncbi:MAG TPA: DUF1684 domain-containing protein [Chloroflexota bacterium]|nr:DUF1684 domain-containing protein [Chloroflexota bacterium]